MLTRPGRLPDRHPPLPSGQSLNPATTSHHARLSFTGHQQGFNHVHPSGLPLARAPGVEPAALRLPPELRTPPSPATHVRGRDRPSSTDLELPLNSHPSISNPVVHSMRATSRRTATSRVVPTWVEVPALVLAAISRSPTSSQPSSSKQSCFCIAATVTCSPTAACPTTTKPALRCSSNACSAPSTAPARWERSGADGSCRAIAHGAVPSIDFLEQSRAWLVPAIRVCANARRVPEPRVPRARLSAPTPAVPWLARTALGGAPLRRQARVHESPIALACGRGSCRSSRCQACTAWGSAVTGVPEVAWVVRSGDGSTLSSRAAQVGSHQL